MLYVMVELRDTNYKSPDGKANLIIPLRLGQFTKAEADALTFEDIEELASDWGQWGQVEGIWGVYFRKG